MSKPAKGHEPHFLDPRRRAFLEALPRKLRNELERALALDGDAARRARAESASAGVEPDHTSDAPER